MLQDNLGMPRMALSQLASPPEGFALRSAVLTTFDLDLSSLSALPADPTAAEGVLVFYGDGRFRDGADTDPRQDLYRSMLIPAVFPPGENGWPRAHAHGKIWLLEFTAETGERRWRLSVHSMNLWPDDNLENQVVFEGQDTGTPQTKTRPLIRYFAALGTLIPEDLPGRVEKTALLRRLGAALSAVRFEPLAPWACEDWELIGPGMNGAAFLRRQCDELLIICQRIQRGGLSMLLQAAGKGVRSITVSNPSSLRELLAEGPAPTILVPQEAEEKYIHAKIFLQRRGGQLDLFCGSMNLTAYAAGRNLEFMVHLKNPARIRTAECFPAGFPGVPEGIDSPVFREALSLPVRYRVLSRLMAGKRASPEECDRMTAYVLSSACERDLAELLLGGLPSVPRLQRIQAGGKTREIYALPLRERLLLALVAQALHRYDGCFSPRLYSHIRGREPVYALTRIRETEDFGSLHLFRTDIRNYGAGMDGELLARSIREVPGMDPVFASFAERLLARREYMLDGVLRTDGPAVMPGNALCGFFENVYLRELDARMEDRAAFYARCADDILIGARTREELERLAEEVRRITGEKKLQLQEGKTALLPPGAPFTFLGWQIRGNRIDFRPEDLEQLRRYLRRETGRLIRECRKQDIPPALRPVMMVPYINGLAARLGLREAFRAVSVPDGLREIDRMLYDMIRAVVSGKTGSGKYRITRAEIRGWGVQSLVNRWYRRLDGKRRKKP